MKIFVPEDSTYNKCYVVQSEGVIRGYAEVPQINRTINYRDYYINSSYIFSDNTIITTNSRIFSNIINSTRNSYIIRRYSRYKIFIICG